jgi:hypothetical protein
VGACLGSTSFVHCSLTCSRPDLHKRDCSGTLLLHIHAERIDLCVCAFICTYIFTFFTCIPICCKRSACTHTHAHTYVHTYIHTFLSGC